MADSEVFGDPTHLRELYLYLHGAKSAVEDAVWKERLEKARADQRAIDAAASNGLSYGSNEKERERYLVIQVAADAEYLQARQTLREKEALLAERQADLEAYLEARRMSREEAQRLLARAPLAELVA